LRRRASRPGWSREAGSDSVLARVAAKRLRGRADESHTCRAGDTSAAGKIGTKKEQILLFKQKQYVDALAKAEQKRYKIAGTPDYPVFVDDQGVMYHGSELIAAC
jgi:hypothetical protein